MKCLYRGSTSEPASYWTKSQSGVLHRAKIIIGNIQGEGNEITVEQLNTHCLHKVMMSWSAICSLFQLKHPVGSRLPVILNKLFVFKTGELAPIQHYVTLSIFTKKRLELINVKMNK